MLKKALNQNYPVVISKLNYNKCKDALYNEIYKARFDFNDGYYSHQFEYIFPEDINYCYILDWCVQSEERNGFRSNDYHIDFSGEELYHEGKRINIPSELDRLMTEITDKIKYELKEWMGY